MSPEDLEKAKKQMASRPQMPDFTDKPAKAELIVKAWKTLPEDRQALLRRIMRVPCANCQQEFKLPVVGRSHSICHRHAEEMYQQMGKHAPDDKGRVVDLAILNDRERSILKHLFAIVYRDENRAKNYKKFDPSIEEVNGAGLWRL